MAGKSFLDALPPDYLPSIFRFFSTRPYNKKWKGYVPIRDVQYLYFGRGELSTKAQEIFSDLSTLSLKAEETRSGGLRLHATSHFPLSPLRNGLLEMMVWSGSAHVKCVKLEYVPKVLMAHQKSVGDVLKLCTRLEALAVGRKVGDDSNFCDLLTCVPACISTLAIGYELQVAEIEAVSMYCKRLRKLNLTIVRFDMKALLESVGASLESLTVYSYHHNNFIRDVQTNCRKIHTFNVYSLLSDTQRAEVTALLVSYGQQLKKASFSGLFLTQFENIVRKCPEVDCRVQCKLALADEVMIGLRDRLVGMSIQVGQVADLDALRHASSHCSRLAHIHWDCTGSRAWNTNSISSILPQLGGSLTSLDIEDKDSLRSPGRREIPVNYHTQLTNLREFRFRGRLRKGVFANMTRGTPVLEIVEIRSQILHLQREYVVEISIDIAETFADCPMLRELVVVEGEDESKKGERIEAVQHVCNLYRTKTIGLFVSLLAVQYLPRCALSKISTVAAATPFAFHSFVENH